MPKIVGSALFQVLRILTTTFPKWNSIYILTGSWTKDKVFFPKEGRNHRQKWQTVYKEGGSRGCS